MKLWQLVLCGFGFLIAAFEIYGPSLHAPFIFDDNYLPFALSAGTQVQLLQWLSGVRPVLMLSYWLNYFVSGENPFTYHLANVLIHAVNAFFVYRIASLLFGKAEVQGKKIRLVALFVASLFFAHPLQTESVAYVAGRSESLSALFFLAAYVLFLSKSRGPISWPRSVALASLFGLAVATKEHMAVLPALFLFTDVFWTTPLSLRAVKVHWRLYALLAALTVPALAFIAKVLLSAQTAGFGMRDLTWYEYFFTECRAIFSYLRLFILPLGQSLDHEYSISHTIFDHGAIVFLLALAALSILAWRERKRFPLASFGWFWFLLLLAPTSSLVPIADPFVERRMYLPLFGVLLIVAEFLRRREVTALSWRAALVAVVIAASALSYSRNVLWGNPLAFWADSVTASPGKPRPYEHLVEAAVRANACPAVKPIVDRAPFEITSKPMYLVAEAKLKECLGDPHSAMLDLEKAATIAPSGLVYELMGLLYGELGSMDDAKRSLDLAVQVDPRSDSAYVSRGYWYLTEKQYDRAIQDYRHAERLNPNNLAARHFAWVAERDRLQSEQPKLAN